MRDEHHRLPESLLETAEFPLQLEAGDGVQRAEGLIEEQQGRVDGEGARHADPLALAARQFVRKPRRKCVRVEAHQHEQLAHASLDAILRPLLEPRQQPHVRRNRKMRKESDFLNHVSDATPELRRCDLVSRLARDPYGAARRHEQTIDEL